jgi:urocanate hydratase
VIYGGIGKYARNWESYHAIVKSLKELENDETLIIQSGMPVAIFNTHRLAPRVIMANTNIMKATWEIFYDLQDKNLTMFAQYTAGPWEYIGTQGVIQGTFETLGAVGGQHFGGSLVGRICLSAGLPSILASTSGLDSGLMMVQYTAAALVSDHKNGSDHEIWCWVSLALFRSGGSTRAGSWQCLRTGSRASA